MYLLTRGGYDQSEAGAIIGIAKLIDITRLATIRIMLLDMLKSIEVDIFAYDPDRYRGEVPKGEVIAFAVDEGKCFFLEIDGPLAGRVAMFDFHAGSDYIWNRLGNDLESFLNWQVHAIALGGVSSAHSEVGSDAIFLLDCGAEAPHQIARMRSFLHELRPTLRASGATAGAFISIDPASLDRLGLADVVP